jgi:hypothetical protein
MASRLWHHVPNRTWAEPHFVSNEMPLLRRDQLCEFHTPEYVDFLKRVVPATMHESTKELQRFNLGSLGQ